MSFNMSPRADAFGPARLQRSGYMKICMGIFVAFVSLAASASGSKKPPLANSELSRIERTLREARDSNEISGYQYQQSLALLHDSQCDTIDRTFTKTMQAKWSAAIAARRQFAGAKAVQSFGSSSWRIIYTVLPNSEPTFLFYSGASPITEWSGGAAVFDAPEIEHWVLTNIPGIPKPLARCFAWHVTFNRKQ